MEPPVHAGVGVSDDRPLSGRDERMELFLDESHGWDVISGRDSWTDCCPNPYEPHSLAHNFFFRILPIVFLFEVARH